MLIQGPLEWRCMRIDCPEWYAREDFVRWLRGLTPIQSQQRSDGKPIRPATWHDADNPTPSEMSDVFFVYDRGEISDPGLPEDIEVAIAEAADRNDMEYGVVWLSNCNLE